MRYRYLDDFRRGISVFAIFSYGIAVLGTPQCPPPECVLINGLTRFKAPISEEIFFDMFSIFVGPGEGLINC